MKYTIQVRNWGKQNWTDLNPEYVFTKVEAIELTDVLNQCDITETEGRRSKYYRAKSEKPIKKWLEFTEEKSKPKTRVFTVSSLYDRGNIGEIRWYPQWRHYCFFTEEDIVYSDRCLMEISEFITKLNEEHKKARKPPKQ